MNRNPAATPFLAARTAPAHSPTRESRRVSRLPPASVPQASYFHPQTRRRDSSTSCHLCPARDWRPVRVIDHSLRVVGVVRRLRRRRLCGKNQRKKQKSRKSHLPIIEQPRFNERSAPADPRRTGSGCRPQTAGFIECGPLPGHLQTLVRSTLERATRQNDCVRYRPWLWRLHQPRRRSRRNLPV